MPNETKTYPAYALAAKDTSGILKKTVIERRACGPDDVKIKIQYCGVCHSDLHQIRAEWDQDVYYPMVPGHEMIGKVVGKGSGVGSQWNVGDVVGIGVFVDSCRTCAACKSGREQYCEGNLHVSYNCCLGEDKDIKLRNSEWGELLMGGYSTAITVDKNYIVRIPSSIPPERAGPLLCAGITTYSPLVHYGKMIKSQFPDAKEIWVGVAGLGGLGHMAIMFANAMGYKVAVISRSIRKKEKAMQLGASKFIVSKDPKQMGANGGSLHLILDTIAANHDPSPMFDLLKTDGALVLLGIPPQPVPVKAFDLIANRRVFAGSMIGSISETVEMLSFCEEKKIYPSVELIRAKDINKKLYVLWQNKAATNRFVIDCSAFDEEANQDADWEAEDEPAINPQDWKVNPNAKVFPKSAVIHNGFPVTENKLSIPLDSLKRGADKECTGMCPYTAMRGLPLSYSIGSLAASAALLLGTAPGRRVVTGLRLAWYTFFAYVFE